MQISFGNDGTYVRLTRGRGAGFSKRHIDPPLTAFDPSPLADHSLADLYKGSPLPTITVAHCYSIILKNGGWGVAWCSKQRARVIILKLV